MTVVNDLLHLPNKIAAKVFCSTVSSSSFFHNQHHHHHPHPHIIIMILLIILITSGFETPRRQDLHREALEANPLHIPRVLLPISHFCLALLKVNYDDEDKGNIELENSKLS